MFDWFNQKDKNKEFKLWQMSESQKFYYARYLGVMGVYYKVTLRNFDTAISYFTKSLNIVDKLDDEANYGLKFNVLFNMSIAYILLGEIKLVEEFLKKIERLLTQGPIQEDDIQKMYNIVRSELLEMQGQYKEALECRDKVIALFIKNGLHINDLYLNLDYIFRANALNSLGRYQEAYAQAQQLYNIYKPLKHKNNETFY